MSITRGREETTGAPQPGVVNGNRRQISPTDVAQFIRLEQCQRYLRLRLYGRNVDSGFMHDYGVVPQSIPPILTRSGAGFEERVEASLRRRYWTTHFVNDLAHAGSRLHDNERVVRTARELAAGEVAMLLQPRLQVDLGEWLIRGDVDILRLERDPAGELGILIADMKSSTAAKVEHRLQVAFYHEMLAALFGEAGVEHGPIEMGILYRGPADSTEPSETEAPQREEQGAAAERVFGERLGLLEIVADPESYRGSVRDLVTGPDSTAQRIAQTDFVDLPYILTYKCDGCMFNEFCMKWSAEEDDLSLLPHLSAEDKNALRRNGVTTVRQLATVKDLKPRSTELVPAPGNEALVKRLSVAWPLGPRLDELIHRARLYRSSRGDSIEALPFIPSKGHGSLPYSDATHNPNLVRVYIDAQHDYLQDRIYMLGSLVVASDRGEARRRRSVVHLTDGPPDTREKEEALFTRWIDETVRAIDELAYPDEEGERRAPIHLIFYNSFEQRLLLEGLARHFPVILGATPLYDFVTQMAAFDSPVASFLDKEIRELKNYPMVCQSLQAVAAYAGKFDWDSPQPYRQIFRAGMFDAIGRLEDPPPGEKAWYTRRARFNSQIPLEYAYAAWEQLESPATGQRDDFAAYRAATLNLLGGVHERRLEAMEAIAGTFDGNKLTEKRVFELPDLSTFQEKAETLAQALDEFVTIERHVELGAWKTARLASPERRVLSGETLLVRYLESDQNPETAKSNRENERRHELEQEWKAANPGERMSKEERAETKWSQEGLRFRLRIDPSALDCELDEILGLTTLREGETIVINPRMTVDSRLPVNERVPFTPTPKQMLYGVRANITGIEVDRDPGTGRAIRAWVEVEMRRDTNASGNMRGFIFGAFSEPLHAGETYTLDSDPNDWYGYFCAVVTRGLVAGEKSYLYERLRPSPPGPLSPSGESGSLGGGWLAVTPRSQGERDGVAGDTPQSYLPSPSRGEGAQRVPRERAPRERGQHLFLEGLDALQHAGLLDPFDVGQREYIGSYGDAPTLMVQGPPGTGKSYTTAFALFARMQGAMAEDRDFRVIVSCKTHAATDVLVRKIADIQGKLAEYRQRRPDIFNAYFDPRLLEARLFRVQPKETVPEGVTPLYKKEGRPKGLPLAADAIMDPRWCVAGAAVGGIYRTMKDRWPDLFGHPFCDCLILDEASQMNLPEAIMAALPLKEDGRLIVVGDHRQMPPIVKHDWSGEARRTFKEFRAFESLFLALLPLGIPIVKFAESFRLHADMAEFLRREIYQQDGIPYFSRNHRTLQPAAHSDPFVSAVLDPRHPLVVVVHDEAASMLRNEFEQALITPILEALADPPYDLDPRHGLGVVVPHRAQRAALREAIPQLNTIDPVTGAVALSAVDTVERFQGDERSAIIVSATESDRDYLLLSSEFLLDPRRLTVALSRAKHKMVLVASQSVFGLFSADEETFVNSQLWKSLLRRTCTEMLWEGEREGRQVQVWGNI